MSLALLVRHALRNRNQDLHCQKTDTILVIARKVLEPRQNLRAKNLGRDRLDEFGEIGSRLATDHRGIIVHEGGVVSSELILEAGRDLLIGSGVETCGGDFRCEPVGLGESENKGDKFLLNLLDGEFGADFV